VSRLLAGGELRYKYFTLPNSANLIFSPVKVAYEKGLKKARELGRYVNSNNLKPQQIYCVVINTVLLIA